MSRTDLTDLKRALTHKQRGEKLEEDLCHRAARMELVLVAEISLTNMHGGSGGDRLLSQGELCMQ